MKHARPDYDRFQDPLGLIPQDEPVMLFRGQDKYASKVLKYYANLVEHDGGDPEIIRRTRQHAAAMSSWAKKKSPDMPKESYEP